MTADEILAQLKALMPTLTQAPVDWARVAHDTPLKSLGFDSLSILDLAYDVSRHFKIEFDLLQAGSLQTVGDVVRLIGRLQCPS